MTAAPHSVIDHHLLAAMVRQAADTPPGEFAELGVYRGGSAWHLAAVARAQHRSLWLFDTFNGIPHAELIDLHKPGDFGHTSAAEVQAAIPDAILIRGIFPDTVAGDGDVAARFRSMRFAFVHVDADQYRSIHDACTHFAPLMVQGGVMWFDDYAMLAGATKAVDDFFPAARIERTLHDRAMVRF